MKEWKYIDEFKKSSSPEPIKLGTNHPWGILDFLNKGTLLFSRGDDYEIVKMHWQN